MIISTDRQTKGRGRQKNQWTHLQDSLAFSLNRCPNPILTLTPLEMGVLISQFFSDFYQKEILLKWPNDLMNNKHEKVGGILCETHGSEVIIGVGVNLKPQAIENFSHFQAGFLFSTEEQIDSKKLTFELAQYLIQESELRPIPKWTQKCSHLKQQVQIGEIKGVFQGLGPMGQAILATEKEEVEVYSGSLVY